MEKQQVSYHYIVNLLEAQSFTNKLYVDLFKYQFAVRNCTAEEVRVIYE